MKRISTSSVPTIISPAMTATYQVGDGSSPEFKTVLLAVRDLVAPEFYGLRRFDSGIVHRVVGSWSTVLEPLSQSSPLARHLSSVAQAFLLQGA
jgi:hypothetical protein